MHETIPATIKSLAGVTHLLSVAVKGVLSDGRFKVVSPQAVSTLETASALNKLWGDQPHKHRT